MIQKGPRFGVRITHIPTGIKSEVTNHTASNLAQAKDMAWKLLRSRLWAHQNGIFRSDSLIKSYELQDDNPDQDVSSSSK